jgi:hypothetical protein
MWEHRRMKTKDLAGIDALLADLQPARRVVRVVYYPSQRRWRVTLS